jgi:hypothetical protein
VGQSLRAPEPNLAVETLPARAEAMRRQTLERQTGRLSGEAVDLLFRTSGSGSRPAPSNLEIRHWDPTVTEWPERGYADHVSDD